MNELINKDNKWIIHFMGSLDRLLDNVEHLTANYRPTLGGERFFTDKEVSARLKVSRRTLQDYRNEGHIAYIQLGGKILYRESDIERMLNEYLRKYIPRMYLIFHLQSSGIIDFGNFRLAVGDG